MWQARSFAEAIELAETEAVEYAELLDLRYVGLSQAFAIAEDELRHGTEVFSPIRDSDLEPGAYLSHFFDTGTERQGRC